MLICQVLDFLRSYSHSVSDPLALVTFVHVTLTHYLFAKAVVAACIGAKFGIDGNPGELPKWYAIVVVLFICIYVAQLLDLPGLGVLLDGWCLVKFYHSKYDQRHRV